MSERISPSSSIQVSPVSPTNWGRQKLSPAEEEANAKKTEAETALLKEKRIFIICLRVGVGIVIGVFLGVGIDWWAY